ncbi:hypothetical protein [Actinoplanes sichuanensis]|uniref:Uncharacterized protein n=1 Tax=Actinoplanes sichuanensis TaxID=512349 RepID=A0ABW4AJF7_9ACTN
METLTEKIGAASVSIMKADYDLTGKGFVRWAADQGNPVEGSRCTNRFRFAGSKSTQVKPNMMLCWRVSADRSVAAVTFGAKDSQTTAAETAQVVARHWAETR